MGDSGPGSIRNRFGALQPLLQLHELHHKGFGELGEGVELVGNTKIDLDRLGAVGHGSGEAKNGSGRMVSR
jgi:hypothetical protein